MNIPDVVKIGGIPYKVKMVDIVSDEEPLADGMVIHHKQEIRIKNNMPDEYTEKVFYHELLHCMFDFCAIEHEEEQAKILSNVLYQILKDNEL